MLYMCRYKHLLHEGTTRLADTSGQDVNGRLLTFSVINTDASSSSPFQFLSHKHLWVSVHNTIRIIECRHALPRQHKMRTADGRLRARTCIHQRCIPV